MPISNRRRSSPSPAALAGLALVLAALAAAASPAGAVVIDRVVASVNGEAITLYELYKAELPVFGNTYFPGGGRDQKTPEDRAKERELLDRIIEERLLMQRAKERGQSVSNLELDEQITRVKADGRMNDEMFAQALTQRGLALDDYREKMRRQITISKLFNSEIRLKTVVTPEEVEAWYKDHQADYTTPEQVKIRHILLLKEGGNAARAQADDLAARLAAGANFVELALVYSQDSGKYKGELSGWIRRGDTLPELEKEIFALEPGKVSPVIETSLGWHIIRVEEKEASKVTPLPEVAEQINNRLTEQKMDTRFRDWLQDIKTKAAIDIKL
jgi:parvulin-like peptidyl-prolyl isomerase